MKHQYMLFAALLVALHATAAADPEDLLAEAKRLVDGKEYAAAVQKYERALAEAAVEQPEFLEAVSSLRSACNHACMSQRFLDAAAKALDRVARTDLLRTTRDRLRKDILLQLAEEHREHHQYFAVIDCYEELLNLVPQSDLYGIRKTLAESYTRAGYLHRAVDAWKQVMDETPGSFEARSALARLYFRLGDAEKGLAVAGHEGNEARTFKIAQELLRYKHLDEAEQLVRDMVDTHHGARALLGSILFERKELDKALVMFQHAFAEAENDSDRAAVAQKLAACHAALGSVPAAIVRRQRELDGALRNKDKTNATRLLVLLVELQKIARDDAAIIRALVQRCEVTDNDRESIRLTGKLVPGAVRNLICLGKHEEAAELLDAVAKQTGGGPWTDCVRCAVLLATDKRTEARQMLEKLEADAGTNEYKLHSLGDKLAACGMNDVAARICRRILELEPDNSIFDTNAHAVLGVYHAHNKRYSEAKAHFDVVHTSMGRGMFMIGEEQFRAAELHTRYRAAGNNAEVLVELLDDPDPMRRLAAVRLLGSYGTEANLAALEKKIDLAPDTLKAEMREAVTSIRSRTAEPVAEAGVTTSGPPSEKLAGLGDLEWVQRDSFRHELRWLVPKDGFMAVLDAEHDAVTEFRDVPETLGLEGARPTAMVFTEHSVWVGTSRGLLMFDRATREWSAFAVDGKHLGTPIRKLSLKDGRVAAGLRDLGELNTHVFDPATRAWSAGE